MGTVPTRKASTSHTPHSDFRVAGRLARSWRTRSEFGSRSGVPPPTFPIARLIHSICMVESPKELGSRLAAVEGWLRLREAWALHQSAVETSRRVESPVAVELGSWKGRSTIALASGLSPGVLYAIDPHARLTENKEETFSEFLANIDRAGVTDRVRPLRTTSHEARAAFLEGAVHLLFVDASHLYKDVLQDIDDWTPALCEDAVVAFNDPFDDGVAKALRERVLYRKSPYRRFRLVENTLFTKFLPVAPWELGDDLAMWRVRAAIALERQWLLVRPKLPERLVHNLKFLRRLFVS
jgi:predicted O-methyltransferase YrrM